MLSGIPPQQSTTDTPRSNVPPSGGTPKDTAKTMPQQDGTPSSPHSHGNSKDNIARNLLIAVVGVLILSAIQVLIKATTAPKPMAKLANLSAGDTIVTVTREGTNGITENHLQDLKFVKLLEKVLIEKAQQRIQQVYSSQGGAGKINVKYQSESWSVNTHNKNFALTRIDMGGFFQGTIITGIKNDTLIKISCLKKGAQLVPMSYGPCADKTKEIFGFSISEPKQ
jgi:hypothetical protein